MYYYTLSKQYPIFTSLGIIQCQNVCVHFFTSLSNVNPFVVFDPLLSLAIFFSFGVDKDTSLFLITLSVQSFM